MLMDREISYRRLRTPSEDGRILIDPPLAEAAVLVDEIVRSRAESQYDFCGRSLRDLVATARTELIATALRYSRQYRDVGLPSDVTERVLLAGHQPELFHPGVWLKCFALGRIAQETNSVAINLLVDSDVVRHPSIRVPGGSRHTPTARAVLFDRPTDPIPYEERQVLDREQFASFGQRAFDVIRPLVPDPLLSEYWAIAKARLDAGVNLGQCLAQSRHILEGQWGLQTLELPQSYACQMESYHWFVAHLLAQLSRFRKIHNAALAEYRQVHRFRGTARPVPDLARTGDWLEAPFWVWTAKNPQRNRLFVRSAGKQLILSDRSQLEIRLDLTPEDTAAPAVEQLAALAGQGIRLRTRALATTLFARTVLGDLFLHGIGGAKYDQVTDRIIDQFFGLRPPAFCTVSATVRLPIERPRGAQDDLRCIDRALRELRFHPERHEDLVSSFEGSQRRSVETIIAGKKRWIETPKTPQNAAARHEGITAANRAMQPWMAQRRQELIAERESAVAELHAASILGSREYAFCLHPERSLRKLILDLG